MPAAACKRRETRLQPEIARPLRGSAIPADFFVARRLQGLGIAPSSRLGLGAGSRSQIVHIIC